MLHGSTEMIHAAAFPVVFFSVEICHILSNVCQESKIIYLHRIPEIFMVTSFTSHKRVDWIQKTEKPTKCLCTTEPSYFTIICHISKFCFNLLQHLFELAVAQSSSPDVIYCGHNQVHDMLHLRCCASKFSWWTIQLYTIGGQPTLWTSTASQFGLCVLQSLPVHHQCISLTTSQVVDRNPQVL